MFFFGIGCYNKHLFLLFVQQTRYNPYCFLSSVVRSEEAAALNKLDSLKMDIRNFIGESRRSPTDLQEFIAEHVQQEMTRDQPPAIKSGIFFLTSLMHQPPHEFYTQLIDTLREEMLTKVCAVLFPCISWLRAGVAL